MIGVVKLTAEPAAEALQDRTVYVAPCDLVPSGRGYKAIMLPPVPGIVLPYRSGDVCLAGIDGGTAYILGAFATSLEHGGHTLLAARAADKNVRLGAGAGAWEPLMLYASAHAEMNAVRSGVKLALQKLSEILPGLGDVPGGTACGDTYLDLLAAAYVGGEPTGGAQGRKA